MPGVSHIGISQRVEDAAERARLKAIVEGAASEQVSSAAIQGGYIIRTAAEAASVDDLTADMKYLHRLGQSINERMGKVQAPAVIYQDLPLFIRTIRDLIRPQTEKVRIDSRESHQRVMEFVHEFVSEFADKVEYYPGERPIFDLYSVEDEIQKALSRKVQLKSGGYVIIDQTEAMTTIDINTGAFVGHRNLEETIFKTNLEAARAISRQLRLRNLGGIIIIDFIDMDDAEHKRQVHRMLEKMLERDHAKTKITGVSELGLVEMTRKRTTESLGQVLCEPCPICDGRGFLKTGETVCYEIFREILRVNRAYDTESYLVMASQRVVDLLVDEESDNVADLETFICKTIRFQVEPFYSQEQYDVVLL
jgi:ribonuclease G